MSTSQTPETPSGNSAGENPPAGRTQLPRRNILIGIAILAALAIGTSGYWFFFLRGNVFTDDARFSGHLVDLAPEINGRIVALLVREGQYVRRGKEVFRLDPSIPQASLNQAEAALASAQASFDAAQAKYEKAVHGNRPEEIRAAEATLKRLENQEELARLELVRMTELARQGAAATAALDDARTAFESARQNCENARQNSVLMQQGSRAEDIAVAKADMKLARSRISEATAAVEHARSDLDRCIVRMPFDGWIVRRWLDEGAMPIVSQPVVSVFDPSTLRVDANIEEKYLGDICVGNVADISVDAYPGIHLKGRVTDILRATNSQFSLIPAEGVSGTFIKVTQRVPLRIAVAAPADLLLGPGLSAEVRIRCGTTAATAPAVARLHE